MKWFPDSFSYFISCVVGLVVSFVAMVISGIGCVFGNESGCNFFTQATEIFSQAAPPVFVPIFLLIAGFLLIRHGSAIFGGFGRLVFGLLKALVAVPLFLLRALVAIPLSILRAIARLPAWLHYVFVPHPAARVLNQAHGAVTPRPIDAQQLADVVRDEPKPPFWFWLVPSFVTRNMAKKAKAHEERLRAETEMMKAAVERERARGSYERHGRSGK